MRTSIITSHHNLERDILSEEEKKSGAPHRVRCLTCKTSTMSLADAEQHASQPLPKKTIGLPQTYTLFTLWP